MNETNLVAEWVKLKTRDGAPIQEALNELNSTLGMSLEQKRLNQYQLSNSQAEGLKRPYRRPSINIINYMLADVLKDLLTQDGLSETRINEIVSKVSTLKD